LGGGRSTKRKVKVKGSSPLFGEKRGRGDSAAGRNHAKGKSYAHNNKEGDLLFRLLFSKRKGRHRFLWKGKMKDADTPETKVPAREKKQFLATTKGGEKKGKFVVKKEGGSGTRTASGGGGGTFNQSP